MIQMRVNKNEILNDRFEWIPCPVCSYHIFESYLTITYGDLKEKKSLDYSALGVTKDTTLFVKRCVKCGFVFVNPRLKAQFAYVVYNDCKQKMYNIKSYLTSIGTQENIAETRKRKVSHMGPLLEILSHVNLEKDGLTLFDYGCGFGYSMSLARELGIKAFGVDIDEERLAVCKHLGLNVAGPVEFDKEFPEVKADIILLQSNIEHIIDLSGTMDYLKRKSQEGAVLYVNGLTPKIISVEKRQGEFVKAHFVEHINYFPVKTLDFFMAKYGYFPLKKDWDLSSGKILKNAFQILQTYRLGRKGAFERIYRYNPKR
jgi:hypothetical protein